MNHPRNVSVEEEVRVTTLLEEEYSMRYVANLIAKHYSSLIAWSDDLTRQDLTFEGQGKDENDVLSAPSKCERQIFLVCVVASIIGVR
jgi:hypothetical protein